MKMTRAQRNFLAIAVFFLAWFFHVNTCDWHWKQSITFVSGIPAPNALAQWSRYSIWTRFDNDPTRGTLTTGVTSEEWLDRGTALVWGIFVPLLMVAGNIWWMLGWRRHSRAAAGCCVSCGYDLKGSRALKCPECGAAQAG